MNESFYVILLFIVIGAILGGGTNIIAIQMIFRPHTPKFIFKKRVPFTPGLIPKRRLEIAEKLGKTVEEYLVTPEGIEEKLLDNLFLEEGERKIKTWIHNVVHDDRTAHQWLKENTNETFFKEDPLQVVSEKVIAKLNAYVESVSNKSLVDLLPEELKWRAEEKLPQMVDHIATKIEIYILSEEGQKQLKEMIEQYIENKGSFTRTLGKMVNRFSLSSILTKEILLLLRDPHTKSTAVSILNDEWQVVLNKPVYELLNKDKLNDQINQWYKEATADIPVIKNWNDPLYVWAPNYEKQLVKNILPKAMEMVSQFLAKYAQRMVRNLKLHEIVANQINQFPIKKLEFMLISIASKELKLIAVFGAILGACIGLIQGIIAILL